MKIQLIRNATLLLDYANHHILIDPDLAAKHARQTFTGKSPNPMVDLPMPIEQILAGVEGVIVSHLHSDHFDTVAQERVPKNVPLFCQPENADFIREKGFQDVRSVASEIEWETIHITRTGGHHGTGEVEGIMKTVSGFVFQAAGEPTLYWAGDTVLCDEVREVISKYQPDVIITHSCGATWPDSKGERSLIVMDAQQTIEVCKLSPDKVVIAVHMEALDHATVSRQQLREAANAALINAKKLLIPDDGGVVEIGK